MQTDRDKLIELITKAYKEWRNNTNLDVSISEFTADHLLANGVIVQEWISVADRLPDVRENPVLVSWGGGVWMAWRHKGWWELPGAFRTNCVTHWMPLPKPPKEEAEEKLKELEK